MTKERQEEIVFEVLYCVMVADGKASCDEKVRLVKLMDEYGCTWSTEEIGQRLSDFVSRIRADGVQKFLDTVWRSAERLDDDHAAQLVEKCHELTRTDDEYTGRERDTVQKIETRLNQLAFIRRQLQTPVKSDNRSPHPAPGEPPRRMDLFRCCDGWWCLRPRNSVPRAISGYAGLAVAGRRRRLPGAHQTALETAKRTTTSAAECSPQWPCDCRRLHLSQRRYGLDPMYLVGPGVRFLRYRTLRVLRGGWRRRL